MGLTTVASTPGTSMAGQVASSRRGSVERVDARQYRGEIISLYERDGNQQFPAQFDWYYRDRGQPPPISWLLRDQKERVCGVCSVTLRDLQFGKINIRAGVAGNLMVDRATGLYLGAFSLVNTMKAMVLNREIDILLGIPNQSAKSIFLRLGFHVIDRWKTCMQAFHSRELLRFYLGFAGDLAGPLVDFCTGTRRALSHWTQADLKGFRVVELAQDELDRLPLEDWPAPWKRFVVRGSSEYLEWRFLRNPLNPCEIAAVAASDGTLCGYLVLQRLPGRVVIVDCGVDHRQLSETAAILSFCRDRQARRSTVWVTSLGTGALSEQLSSCGFVSAPPKMGGYPDYPLVGFWLPEHSLASAFCEAGAWNLFPGFNDV